MQHTVTVCRVSAISHIFDLRSQFSKTNSIPIHAQYSVAHFIGDLLNMWLSEYHDFRIFDDEKIQAADTKMCDDCITQKIQTFQEISLCYPTRSLDFRTYSILIYDCINTRCRLGIPQVNYNTKDDILWPHAIPNVVWAPYCNTLHHTATYRNILQKMISYNHMRYQILCDKSHSSLTYVTYHTKSISNHHT